MYVRVHPQSLVTWLVQCPEVVGLSNDASECQPPQHKTNFQNPIAPGSDVINSCENNVVMYVAIQIV